jgi:hypothetical protein
MRVAIWGAALWCKKYNTGNGPQDSFQDWRKCQRVAREYTTSD